jgi:hypothetical protein
MRKLRKAGWASSAMIFSTSSLSGSPDELVMIFLRPNVMFGFPAQTLARLIQELQTAGLVEQLAKSVTVG